jgi:cell wall-associated NlpC family hydrolase
MRPSPVFTTREIPVETDLVVVAREDLLNEISMYHGVAYRPGGDSFDGVDCSGLVQAVFSPLGVKLPRTVVDQYESGIPVGRRDVKTGDLVFFGGRTPDHVGIAVSAKEMVHASLSRGVILENIDNFAKSSSFEGARRIVALR